MRKITGVVFQSLDGVMQAPGGPAEDTTGKFALGGWQMPYTDDVANAAIGTLLTPPFALLLGRRTYDIFASYWPYVRGDLAGVGNALGGAEKYVLTRGNRALEWDNSRRITVLNEVADLKAGDGPDIRVWGSSTLYPTLLATGLLDEITTLTYPLVLGSGKRTFGDGTPPGALRLIDHAIGSGGVVVASYAIDGPVQTGEAPPALPNALDEARKRRMRRGDW